MIKGETNMQHLIRIFLRGAVSLTAILVMTAAFQVQAAPTPDHSNLSPLANSHQSVKLLLAQKTEPAKDKQLSPCPSPPPPDQKTRTLEKPPSPQMERMDKSVIRDEPQKAGTKKIGGQTIRAKETPGEE
jgi:hypothetical protein